MKVVICTMPMRPSDQVKSVIYPVDGDKALEYDKPVRCPVNAVLAKTLKKGDELKVIYIMTVGKNSSCEENKTLFIEELEKINAEIGVVISYDTVEMEFSATKQTYNKLISDLTEKIPKNAKLYLDITYGSKPEILSLFCALRFVEEFRNAIVEYFIYGKAEFNKKTGDLEDPLIYDITSLYYLFKMIGSLGAADEKTALKKLKIFFDL
jgi:hypothetical protein